MNDQDKQALQALVQKMMQGFSGRDAAMFAAPFAENADCIVRDSRHLKGRAAIQELHEAIFSNIYSEGKSEYSVEQMRLLRQDVALVLVQGRLQYQDNGVAYEVKGRITLVCVKETDGWEIASFQNTSVQEEVNR